MAIKAGQILHDVNGYVIDRIQTGGPGQLNIPEEKIYELGNQYAVAIVRDIPDLSFDLESLDVSTEFESMLLAKTPGAISAFDFNKSIPIDVISPFKSLNSAFDIVRGLAVPCLSLERVTYRFGVRQSSTQMFTLRGDSIYYVPGVPFWEEVSYTPGTNVSKTYSWPGATGSPTAIDFREQGKVYNTLAVMLYNSTTGAYKRLFYGEGYQEHADNGSAPAAGTGFIIPDAHAGFDKVRFTYAGATSTVSYTDTGNSPHGHPVHQGISTKPAAVRGKDIRVSVGQGGTTSWRLFRGVQTAEFTRSVNLQNDEELGNHHYVNQDYIVPDVTGQFQVRPADTATLWQQISDITGVNAAEAIGPQTTTTVPVKAEILDPDTGSVLKTIFVPDARFKVPGLSGRANQKLETTFAFTSDSGAMTVYNGAM